MNKTLAVFLGLAMSGCAIKNFAPMLTSGGGSSQQDRDLALLQYAMVLPVLNRPYDEPAKVADCVDAWAKDPEAFATLWDIGDKRAGLLEAKSRMALEGVCRSTSSTLTPFFKDVNCSSFTGEVFEALNCKLERRDQLMLAHAVLNLADNVNAQVTTMWPTAKAGEPEQLQSAYGQYLPRALVSTALVIRRAPPHMPGDPRQRPVLSLSGGAANGAFSAGFVYRLLSLREQARAAQQKAADAGDADAKAAVKAIDENERFDAIVGVSVGSLIAPVVDLYFDDARKEPVPLTPEQKDALNDCLGAVADDGNHVPPERLAQACALRLLRQHFTYSNEWSLMCVERDSVLSLLGLCGGKRANVLAFDPMERLILGPFFEKFAARTTSNDVRLQVLAVDVLQRTTFPLDENACLAPPGTPLDLRWTAKCLTTNVMASLVEPVLARHVSEVFTGFTPFASPGQRGQWLDGGLRTGSPVMQALRMTHWPWVPKRAAKENMFGTLVLSVSTHRGEGTPTSLRETLPALAFDTVNNFAEQMRSWELNLVGAVAQSQFEESKAWSPPLLLATATRPDEAALGFPAATVNGGLVDSVLVPESLEPGARISASQASEYTFDPVTMTRLFLLGEQSLVNERLETAKRLKRLGWLNVAAWYEQHTDVNAEVSGRASVANGAVGAAYESVRKERSSDCFLECTDDEAFHLKKQCKEDLLPAALKAARPSLPWK